MTPAEIKTLRSDIRSAEALLDNVGERASALVSLQEVEAVQEGIESVDDLENSAPQVRAVMSLGAAISMVQSAAVALDELIET